MAPSGYGPCGRARTACRGSASVPIFEVLQCRALRGGGRRWGRRLLPRAAGSGGQRRMFGTRAVRDQIVGWVDRAIAVQDGVVRAHVAQVREAGPDTSPQRVTAALESQYLTAVSAAGAAVGGAASVPAVGTGIAVGLSVAETVAFLDATALFVLATAETLGSPVSDLARRRALLLVALLGDDAVA